MSVNIHSLLVIRVAGEGAFKIVVMVVFCIITCFFTTYLELISLKWQINPKFINIYFIASNLQNNLAQRMLNTVSSHATAVLGN